MYYKLVIIGILTEIDRIKSDIKDIRSKNEEFIRINEELKEITKEIDFIKDKIKNNDLGELRRQIETYRS